MSGREFNRGPHVRIEHAGVFQCRASILVPIETRKGPAGTQRGPAFRLRYFTLRFSADSLPRFDTIS